VVVWSGAGSTATLLCPGLHGPHRLTVRVANLRPWR
jgi:hypothetical protein